MYVRLYNFTIFMNHLSDGTGASSPRDLDLEIGQADVLDVDLESAAASIIDQKSENFIFFLFSDFWLFFSGGE